MKTIKVVKSRTPERVTVDFGAIPEHKIDAMCRTVIGYATRLFEDPAEVAEFERWREERRLEGVKA